jgi:type I restriction enzyme, S subunit
MSTTSAWTQTRVDRVATVNARIGWKALTASEYQPDGYVFLATPNIKYDPIDFENVNYINKFRYDESPELKLRIGDVLLAKDGSTLGITNVVHALPRPATVNGSIAVLRAFGIDPRFLRYSLASSSTQRLIEVAKGGMGVPHLFQWDIRRLPIALPPFDEQRRIADFLDAEAAKIAKLFSLRSLQVDLLDQREKSWRSGLFLKSRSGIWVRVKNLLRAKPRYGVLVPEFVDDGVPFIRVGDLSGLSDKDGLTMIPEHLSAQYSRSVTMLDDVLVAVVGATIGKVAVVSDGAVGANTNRAIAVLRLHPRHVPSLFATWVGGAEFKEQALLATGADSAQPTLGMEDLANFSLRWPADDLEQKLMTNSATEHQLETAATHYALNRQNSLLAERRQALITAAVTGQIDVTTARGLTVSGGAAV